MSVKDNFLPDAKVHANVLRLFPVEAIDVVGPVNFGDKELDKQNE
jgi:hypothetical protein